MKLLEWSVSKNSAVDVFYIIAEVNCTRYNITAVNTPGGDWQMIVNDKLYLPSGWEVGPEMINRLKFKGLGGKDAWAVVVALENVMELDMTYEAYVRLRDNLKQIAEENYNNGGDVMVECWDNLDWQDFIVERRRYNDDPVEWVKMLMGNYEEQRKGIENTAF